MIVIRGKTHSGKGRILINEISKLSDSSKIWIIDMGNAPKMSFIYSCLNCCYTKIDNLKQADEYIGRLQFLQGEDRFDLVVLYFDVSDDYIEYFKRLELLYGVNFILMVQDYADSENEGVLVQLI